MIYLMIKFKLCLFPDKIKLTFLESDIFFKYLINYGHKRKIKKIGIKLTNKNNFILSLINTTLN